MDINALVGRTVTFKTEANGKGETATGIVKSVVAAGAGSRYDRLVIEDATGRRYTRDASTVRFSR
jgi:hypothetical protein